MIAVALGWFSMRSRRAREQQAILRSIIAAEGTAKIGDEEVLPTARELFFDGNYINRIDEVSYISFSDATVDIAPLAGLKNLQIFG